MGLYGTVALCTVIMMLLNTGVTQDTRYYIYHHCYFAGGKCGTKNISCRDNLVINIVWSIIGYSDYWKFGKHQNCSVTNRACYQNVTEPSRNCSGLQTCTLYTCSNVIHQTISCTGGNATNFLRINYTCVKESPKLSVTKTEAGMTLTPDIHTVSVTETPTPGVNMTEETTPLKRSAQKKTIVVISVVISATVLIATVVIVIILIIKRRKTSPQGNDPKQISTSGRSVKDDTDITVTDNVNYVTCDDAMKAKTTSAINGPVTDANVVDDINYGSITNYEDVEPMELPPSKTGLFSDTELVDNVNYGGLGEEVTGSKVTSTTGDYDLAGPVLN